MSRKYRNRRKKLRAAQVETPAEVEAEEKVATEFSLKISPKTFEKIMYWINKASPNEVSGFGSLDFDEVTREFTVKDAILLKQEVSGGSTEIDENAINRAMFEQRNEPGALKWHWHSHPTFGVFWSGTDMDLIRQLGQQGWIVATVLNCKRESRTAFLTSVEVLGQHHDIFVDDFPLIIENHVTQAERKQYDAEFTNKVTEKKREVFTPRTFQAYERDLSTYGGFSAGRRKLYKIDYDEMGFAKVGETVVYNPAYDLEVPTRAAQIEVISEMTAEEINFLLPHDYVFASLVAELRNSDLQ